MLRQRKRFHIEPLEDRIAPAILTISPTTVGGVAEGDPPCFHPVPDQAATGLQQAALKAPDGLVTLGQGDPLPMP
jgi:hypothetical protein